MPAIHPCRGIARVAVALALPLLASCATFAHPREDPRETQLVATDEAPGSVGGPALPDQARDDSVRSDVALGAAHLVANDGQWYRTIHEDNPSLRGGLCGVAASGLGYDPLMDGGVYRSYAPRVVDGSWVFVGLALGGRDGIGPMVFSDVCGEAWLGDAFGARVRGLAPGVTMRDTSLLFTTRGRSVPSSGAVAGVVGGLIEFFGPPATRSEAPRTAKPRDAQPAAAPAPAQTIAPAKPSAPANAPEPAKDDRRTSSPPSSSGGRPRGSPMR